MKVIVVKRENKHLILLLQNNKLHDLHVAPEQEGLLGNIYLARVQKIIPGLQAAFVDIEKGTSCFLQKVDLKSIKGNDEIPVQVVAEASKSKQPAVSCELSLQGQFCAVALKKPGLSFSGQLSVTCKKKIKEALSHCSVYEKYHVIIRTNAGELSDYNPLTEEMVGLAQELSDLLDAAPHRTCFSLLRKEALGYVKAVRDIKESTYDEIVTDIPEVFEILYGLYGEKVRFYQDEMITLSKLYSVETHLQNALSKKVWLDSGGFLVIEPTEALTVIDVNTGKYDNKKIHSFLPVNKQAAEEIARQMRIRNLSGIIIVDFINMESEKDNLELLAYLRELVKKDSVKTRVIDMTPLGLMEITRQKTSKTLWEVLSQY